MIHTADMGVVEDVVVVCADLKLRLISTLKSFTIRGRVFSP